MNGNAESNRMKNPSKIHRIGIYAVLLTGISKFVMMDWLHLDLFYIISMGLIWGYFFYTNYHQDPSILKHWGIHTKNFKRSFLFLLPFGIISMGGLIAYGYFNNVNILNWRIIPILFLYPGWGLLQQFIFLAIIGRMVQEMIPHTLNYTQRILFISILFSLIHAPNVILMICTFCMEWLFATAYFRWKNLLVPGLFHGWIASFLLYFLFGRDLWQELFSVF